MGRAAPPAESATPGRGTTCPGRGGSGTEFQREPSRRTRRDSPRRPGNEAGWLVVDHHFDLTPRVPRRGIQRRRLAELPRRPVAVDLAHGQGARWAAVSVPARGPRHGLRLCRAKRRGAPPAPGRRRLDRTALPRANEVHPSVARRVEPPAVGGTRGLHGSSGAGLTRRQRRETGQRYSLRRRRSSPRWQ